MQATLLQRNTTSLVVDEPFLLEGGGVLPQVTIGYTTAGELNEDHSNVVWVFHALTANSDPFEWWPELFGEGRRFNPEKYFVVCANMLGSCYGSTAPEDFHFPIITIHDMVEVHKQLRAHLGIEKIHVGIGGSMGGQQLLEWAVQEPELFENIMPIATNAYHSPWGIAFNEAQRMALNNKDREKGLEAARAIAMLSYRHYNTYDHSQKDEDQRWDHFSAASYQQYQGFKLRKRFTPESYYYLSKAMDSHHLGRHFASVADALGRITARCLVIGVASDILFPVEEQKLLAQHIPNASLEVIESIYGHDGFLVEMEAIDQLIKNWIDS
ncbi:MAG: homoserine O-acetyltransferase [Cytophagales bacterium]|nr:homoserine O-acetyltransferase [Cytophagales bacterium]